jgi:hypothetical protein
VVQSDNATEPDLHRPTRRVQVVPKHRGPLLRLHIQPDFAIANGAGHARLRIFENIIKRFETTITQVISRTCPPAVAMGRKVVSLQAALLYMKHP